MDTRNDRYIWKTVVCTTLLLFVAGWVAAAPYVIRKSGTKHEGKDIRKMRNGDIVLTKENGDRLTFTEDQVEEAVADKPRRFDAAVEAVKQGKNEMATDALEKIVDEYEGLSWDVKAMPYLARAYAGTEQYQKAVNLFQDMFEENPELKNESELMMPYSDVLLKAGKTATLKKLLDEMISEGDRKAAAKAQLMRGNIKMEEENYKGAAKDYLRTVYFFRNIESVMPEATYKLAQALEKMRDNRAEKWYKTVVQRYPGTEYAQKAKGKI